MEVLAFAGTSVYVLLGGQEWAATQVTVAVVTVPTVMSDLKFLAKYLKLSGFKCHDFPQTYI